METKIRRKERSGEKYGIKWRKLLITNISIRKYRSRTREYQEKIRRRLREVQEKRGDFRGKREKINIRSSGESGFFKIKR